MRTSSTRVLSATCWLLIARVAIHAQAAPPDLQWVNSEWERYWRVLQVAGDVAAYPWSNREFGPAEVRMLRATADHPWSMASHGWGTSLTAQGSRVSVELRPVEARTIFNSTVPYGFNEGPVWAGRGLTAVLSGGGVASVGPISASLAPVFFEAQNTRFELLPNGYGGKLAYGFPYPWGADMPQRFGNRPYHRLDAGNSFIRLDAGGVATGFSTAAQHWGPARDQPLVLGSNAGGFPHVFLGTAHPLRLGPVRVHGKIFWGRLSQSDYTPMDSIARHRFAPGAVLVLTPERMPGLELGAGRFVHLLWRGDMLTASNLLRPLGKLLDTSGVKQNSVASVFGRWVFQGAGVEVYGEYAKEDGNLSVRHLLMEPDHAAGYLLGFQRVWGKSTPARSVVRAEVLNTRSTTPHLIPSQNPFYVHSPISQGHTNCGLALGAAGGFGGGASTVAYERYSASGRWSVTWTRLMRAEYLTAERGWVPIPEKADVFHALGVDGIVFRGRSALTYELTGVYEVNRNFQRNAFNVRASSGIRFTL